jgi:exopolysaccharide production protein ExoZ
LSAAETLVAEAFEAAPAPADPPAEPPPRATLLNVQALRALAAVMVVFVHIEALAVMAGGRAATLEFGNAGVDLFFVISGFIMVFTTGRKPMGPVTFLAARWRRIAPLYWSATLAVFAIAVLAPRLLQNTQGDLPHLIASLLFLPLQRADGAMRPVVFVGWTLNFEMAFYVLFAGGLMLRRRRLGVLATFAVLAAAVAWGQWARPQNPMLAFYTTPMVLEFGFGMLLGLAWPYLPRRRWPALALGAAAVAAFALILAAPGLWPGGERMVVFGLPAVVIVAAALTLERSGLALRWEWTRQLGNASYAIYLSHFFVTQAAVLVAGKLQLHGPLAALFMGIVALAGAGAAGLALHYALERPLDAALGAVKRRLAPPRLSFR